MPTFCIGGRRGHLVRNRFREFWHEHWHRTCLYSSTLSVCLKRLVNLCPVSCSVTKYNTTGTVGSLDLTYSFLIRKLQESENVGLGLEFTISTIMTFDNKPDNITR